MPQDFCLKPCAVHVDEIIKFYCPSCQQFVCSRCKEEHHTQCSGVSHLPALVQRLDLTAKTRVTCSSLEKALSTIITREEKVDENIKSVGLFATIAKTAIEKQAQAVKDWLDSNCKMLKQEVSELEVSAKAKLKSERTQLNLVKSEIESLKTDIDNKEKIGKRCELFMSLSTAEDSAITDRISRVLQTDASKYNFKASTKLLAILKDQSLGSIERVSNCDTTTSTHGSTNSRLEPTRYKVTTTSTLGSINTISERTRSNKISSSSRCSNKSRQELPRSNEESEDCAICLDKMGYPKTIECGHSFYTECIDRQFEFKAACPVCGRILGKIIGDQPAGTMTVQYSSKDLCGFPGKGQIIITYRFKDGFQKDYLPSPGILYSGKTRVAYLPMNKKGQQVLKMLQLAFDRKLVFTIGRSLSTGKEGVITWNGISHKTDPGPNTQNGYPDSGYLDRVIYQLSTKGITPEDVSKI